MQVCGVRSSLEPQFDWAAPGEMRVSEGVRVAVLGGGGEGGCAQISIEMCVGAPICHEQIAD